MPQALEAQNADSLRKKHSYLEFLKVLGAPLATVSRGDRELLGYWLPSRWPWRRHHRACERGRDVLPSLNSSRSAEISQTARNQL